MINDLVAQGAAAADVAQSAAVSGSDADYNAAVDRSNALVDQLNAAIDRLHQQVTALAGSAQLARA